MPILSAAVNASIIDALLRPRSVAVIGASDNPNKVGGRPVHYLSRYGFAGRIYPINPGRDEIQGHRAYPSLDALDTAPDAAVIAVAGDAALEQVRRCAAAGVRAAVVMASGFAETGDAGRRRQDELVAAAHAGGMRIVGPNAQGTANFASGAVLNFSTMFMEVAPADGPIAIVSQSGAASVMPYALLRQAGLGVRYLVATGNDADLDACAMAEAVAADEAVRLVLIYLESLSDPARLAAAAAIARRRGAAVVVLKSGGSKRGAAAAASHTGAMVGNDAAIDAFLARHGIWRAPDIAAFVRAAPLYLQGHDPGLGRTVVISHSGAVGVMAADLAERAGLPLTDLAPATQDALAQVLPDFGTAANPLDMTAALLGQGDLFPRALGALGSDPGANMVMIGIPVAGPGYDVEALAGDAAGFVDAHARPLVVSAPQASVRAAFDRRGVPTYVTEADAIAALHQYAMHRRLMEAAARAEGADARGNALGNVAGHPADAGAGTGLLDEYASLSLLGRYGVPVVPQRLCETPEQAVQAAAALAAGDAPVVVKGCAASVPHKSEHGLVHLRLAGAAQVRAAASACLGKLAELGVDGPRVLVAPMVKGTHEFALGVTVDPQLGPLVMIGDGGTLLELRQDIVTLLAPFDLAAAREACRRLRVAPLFDGYRDMPPLDLDALADAAVALGEFAMACGGTLMSVDINPLMVMPAGQGAMAVDAVVEMR
ncbi:CoA-binding protein [Cupriavidus gilardii]|uniref:CoA-binding protein n=1 Tax=Cupriavidus cauae TaxID=2608999 RepID=A0A5M8AAF0_9BURK|nr:CoA-binding protein [Cupriavidus gilardii]KAA6120778.1 CoA-binding protein [Cupriavidus cauae]